MATSRKTPQDRKPKAEKVVRPEDTPGFNLMKSIDEVPVWDQAPLLALVYELMGDAKEGEEVSLSDTEAIPILGKIGKAMLPWAKDEKEFTKFCSGRDAMQRMAELAIAWTSVLGEDESSDDS
jgi:hypothetical protein